MAPRRRRLPSFYKILLDRSAPHLALPAGFVWKHLENNIPDNPILKSVNGGYSWKLKIKKEGEVYYFADGWNDVVEDSELGFGDFLVFWLVDQSTFKLSVFSPNGCEKDFPQKSEVENDDHVEEEEEEEEEAEEVEEEDDDDDCEDDNDVEEAEEEEDDEEEEEEKEFDEEEEDGGGDIQIDGDEGDPFFMKIISKDHKYSLRLPMEFVRLAGMEAGRIIRMKGLEGKEWPMKLLTVAERRHYNRYYLSSGWSEFRKVNKLCEGDKCVFKLMRSQDKLCLAKLTKKRAPVKQPTKKAPPEVEIIKRLRVRPSRVEVVRKDGGAEVVKRSRGRSFKRKRGRPTRV